MKDKSTLIIGVLLSPLALLIISVVNGLMDNATNWKELFTSFFAYVYPVGLIGIIIFGIPCSLILKHYGHLNYFTLAGAGFLGGAALGTLATPVIGSMLLYGGCGLLAASCFWFFTIYVSTKITIENKH